ncbi:MAG: C25 family cysteine peptidase [Candidatus Cloacimonadaceae bacterium]|nr:C25 family cysteine peptidase [Candidatus Cloacimonadaceae bacterium]
MKLYIILLALVLPLLLGATGMQVLEQSGNELLIEFTLPEYEIGHQNLKGATWHKLMSEYGSIDSQEGFPELLVFGEAVAVPIDGDISIQVLGVKSSVIRNINLMPSPKMVLSDYEVDYVFYQDAAAYNSSTAYPHQIVQKGESAFIGDRRFVPLRIFPFQYRAASKELVVNSRISICVTIHGTKNQSKNWMLSENPVDPVADSFFLNNATSKSWRLEKTSDQSYESPKNGTSTVNEIQLVVDKEGIYKVTYTYLNNLINTMVDSLGVQLAWNLNTLDPRYLELKDKNGSVPIHFFGESDGSFGVNDFFEFFGDRNYGDTAWMDDYTAENVYTLSLKSSLGARMAVENGGLVVSNPAQYIVPDAYEETVHFEEQLVSDKLGRGWSALNPEYYREDVWFWKKISAPNLDIVPIELQYPRESTIRTASAKVVLFGLSYSETILPNQYDHEASVRINQAMINSHTWRGQAEMIFNNQNPIPNSFLRHGTNHIYISLSGNTVSGDREQVLLDYVEIKYWREYKTNQDWIKFSKPSNRPAGLYQFQVEGFPNANVSVYKIGSSIFNNLQIEPFSLGGMAPWTVTFQDSVSSNAVRYYAVSENQKMTPKFSRLNLPSNLKNPNKQADVILITTYPFLEAEGTNMLKTLWESNGYGVTKVDVQDIFDEFNSGIRSAKSIKDFITYAYNNWSTPQLRHVVLLGEGVDDERDFSPSRQYALIPVKKTWTYKHGATASDNWYACIVGTDTVPDISISRIGIWREDQILAYANKAGQYRNNPLTSRLWSSHLTFASGGKISDPNNIFAHQSERIRRKSVPKDYRVTRVYTSAQEVSPDYFGGTFALKDAINSGTQYLQFMGHGGGRIWADYNLFNFNDVATLNNQAYPIVLSLACYASAFDTNGSASISEALVLQPNKGAIAALGFTGLGYLYQDEDWGLAFTEALYKHNFPSVGEALQFALAKFYTTTSTSAARYALTNGASYLGDPLIKTRKPIGGIPIDAVSYVLQPGDTLRVSAQFPPSVTAARLFIMKQNEKTINVPFDLPVIQGNFNATWVIPVNQGTNYSRIIYVAGYSSNEEYIGRAAFGVGRSAIFHHALEPANPAWTDSTKFMAKVFSNEDILSLICKVRTDSTNTTITWVNLPMQPHPTLANTYITTQRLPGQITGKEIFYKYVLTTSVRTSETFLESHVYRGPDLFLRDIRLVSDNDNIVLQVLASNIGDAPSITTDLRLYYTASGGSQILHSTQDISGLGVNEQRWETIQLTGLPAANMSVEVRVNWSNTFPEWHIFYNTNNMISMSLPFNYHNIGSTGGVISSIDNNMTCEIPDNLIPVNHTSVFYVHNLSTLAANNQPDISPIKLLSSDASGTAVSSIPYEIKTLDSSIVDSTGTFINGRRIKLTYFYSAADAQTQSFETENSYKIYRWDDRGRKWILQGGNISTTENRVVFEVNKQGIYTIYRNRDRIRPSIDVNVQDQEFTIGGYVSGKGTISLLLSDSNGIDVFDNSIRLHMNGMPVPESDYVTSINLDNINRIPIKYQLNLSRGNYTLVVDCKDVNGNFNTRDIQFRVNETFNITNIGNYPNPVLGIADDPKNYGRTRFTYVLTDDASEVTIKVYTVSGRLVKTFANLPSGVGYHEFPRSLYGWDCKDEYGFNLANGVYFYKIIARQGNKKIEKTMKMAILK